MPYGSGYSERIPNGILVADAVVYRKGAPGNFDAYSDYHDATLFFPVPDDLRRYFDDAAERWLDTDNVRAPLVVEEGTKRGGVYRASLLAPPKPELIRPGMIVTGMTLAHRTVSGFVFECPHTGSQRFYIRHGDMKIRSLGGLTFQARIRDGYGYENYLPVTMKRNSEEHDLKIGQNMRALREIYETVYPYWWNL